MDRKRKALLIVCLLLALSVYALWAHRQMTLNALGTRDPAELTVYVSNRPVTDRWSGEHLSFGKPSPAPANVYYTEVADDGLKARIVALAAALDEGGADVSLALAEDFYTVVIFDKDGRQWTFTSSGMASGAGAPGDGGDTILLELAAYDSGGAILTVGELQNGKD